jgi:hypothetical protein
VGATQVFRCDGEAAVRHVTAALAERGLQVMRTFDLRAALAAGQHGECACPHHGTEQCDCQYIVLLIYGDGALREPATAVLHSQGGQTLIEVLPAGRPLRLSNAITDALATAALDLCAPAEGE